MPPPLPTPTTEFFRRAQAGSRDATADLFERVRGRLFRFCLYLTGNREIALDLCQDAYVKVLENLHSLDNPGFFVPWLFRITKNHFLDFVRSPKSRELAGSYDLLAGLQAPGRHAVLASQITQALSGLKPEERYLVLLVHLEERSYAEVAAILGVSEEAVRGKLKRIRASLRGDFFTAPGDAARGRRRARP